jgi:hypothetical protein
MHTDVNKMEFRWIKCNSIKIKNKKFIVYIHVSDQAKRVIITLTNK